MHIHQLKSKQSYQSWDDVYEQKFATVLSLRFTLRALHQQKESIPSKRYFYILEKITTSSSTSSKSEDQSYLMTSLSMKIIYNGLNATLLSRGHSLIAVSQKALLSKKKHSVHAQFLKCFPKNQPLVTVLEIGYQAMWMFGQ